MKDVAKFFEDGGWQSFGRDSYKDADLYGLRMHGTPCACNDRLSIHAAHYRINLPNGEIHESVEFDITGESADGQWLALKAYGVRLQDLTVERLEHIKRRLLAAWEAAQA
jgi:hypothetical protein